MFVKIQYHLKTLRRRWHASQTLRTKRKALGVLVGLFVLGGVALAFAITYGTPVIGCTPSATVFGKLDDACVMEGEGYSAVPHFDYQVVSTSAMSWEKATFTNYDPDDFETGTCAELMEKYGGYSHSACEGTLTVAYKQALSAGETKTVEKSTGLFAFTWAQAAYDEKGNHYDVVLTVTAVTFYNHHGGAVEAVPFLGWGTGFSANGTFGAEAKNGIATAVTFLIKLLDPATGQAVTGVMPFYMQDLDIADSTQGSRYSVDQNNTNKSAYPESISINAGQKSDIYRGNYAGINEKYTTLYLAKNNTATAFNGDTVWGSQVTGNSDGQLEFSYSSFVVLFDVSGSAEFTWYASGGGSTLWTVFGMLDVGTGVENGEITDGGQIFPNGSYTVDYAPDEGYLLSYVEVDGERIDITKYPNSYTFENATENHTIEAVYVKPEMTKTATLTVDGEPADVSGQVIGAGSELTYAISWENPTDAAYVITITDIIPDGLELVGFTPAAELSGDTVTWIIDAAAGESGTVYLTCFVPTDLEGETVINTANETFTGKGSSELPSVTIGDATEVTILPSPVKAVWNEAGKNIAGATLEVGSELIYTITVANPAEETLAFTIIDSLPAGTVFLVASDGGVYDEEARTVVWELELAAGETVTVFVRVSAGAEAVGTTLRNTADLAVVNPDGMMVLAETNMVENPIVAKAQAPDTGGTAGGERVSSATLSSGCLWVASAGAVLIVALRKDKKDVKRLKH